MKNSIFRKFKYFFALMLLYLVGVFSILLASSKTYATGTFTATGSLNYGRSGHSATLLPNGKVLIVGGNTYVYATDRFIQQKKQNYMILAMEIFHRLET